MALLADRLPARFPPAIQLYGRVQPFRGSESILVNWSDVIIIEPQEVEPEVTAILSESGHQTLGLFSASGHVVRPTVLCERVLEQLQTALYVCLPHAGILHFHAPDPSIPSITLSQEQDDEEELEEHYRYLGQWSGPFGTAEGRQREVEFWRGRGTSGVEWLIARLERPTDVDASSRIAAILARLGNAALRAISGKLKADTRSFDQCYTLLTALAWMKPIQPANLSAFQVRGVIERHLLANDDPTIREQAVSALSILPKDDAVELARRAQEREVDEDVREALADKLVSLQKD